MFGEGWRRIGLVAGLAVAIGGCDKINPDFDEPSGADSDGSSTSTTSAGTTNPSSSTTNGPTSSSSESTSTTGTTSEGTITDSTTDESTTDESTTDESTTDSTTTDDSTSTGEIVEGTPCSNDDQCGGAFPLCGPDGCQDGNDGDACNTDAHCGVASPFCGPASTCQDGLEGDACNGPADCDTSASICSSTSVCQDGSEGDACTVVGDCAVAICSTAGICQDGNEGDACGGTADCNGGAPICTGSGSCQDGSVGDSCADATECGQTLVCGGTCAACSTLSKVEVVTDLTHTWVGDLTIKLVSPAGSVETLVSIPGGAENADDGSLTPAEYGDSSNIDGPIRFDDDAPTSSEAIGAGLDTAMFVCIDDNVCDYSSSGFPNTVDNLTNLVGESPVGEWNLCLADSVVTEVGTLNQWTLDLTCPEGTASIESPTMTLVIPEATYDGSIGTMTCTPLSF
jgi:subtilisin-like proprotein convertase family protein